MSRREVEIGSGECLDLEWRSSEFVLVKEREKGSGLETGKSCEKKIGEGIVGEHIPRRAIVRSQMDLECSPLEDPNRTGEAMNISIESWNQQVSFGYI